MCSGVGIWGISVKASPGSGPALGVARSKTEGKAGREAGGGRGRLSGELVQNTLLTPQATAPQGPNTFFSPKEIFIVTCNFNDKRKEIDRGILCIAWMTTF